MGREKIYTRQRAAEIVEMFEDVLDTAGIRVPSPDDEEQEREADNDAPLYGTVYGNLLSNVEDAIISLLVGTGMDPEGYVSGEFGEYSDSEEGCMVVGADSEDTPEHRDGVMLARLTEKMDECRRNLEKLHSMADEYHRQKQDSNGRRHVFLPHKNDTVTESLLNQAMMVHQTENGICVPETLAEYCAFAVEVKNKETDMQKYLFSHGLWGKSGDNLVDQKKLEKAVKIAGDEQKFCHAAIDDSMWDWDIIWNENRSYWDNILNIALEEISKLTGELGGRKPAFANEAEISGLLIPCKDRSTAESLLRQAQSAYLSDNGGETGIRVPMDLVRHVYDSAKTIYLEQDVYDYYFADNTWMEDGKQLAEAVKAAGGANEFCRQAAIRAQNCWDPDASNWENIQAAVQGLIKHYLIEQHTESDASGDEDETENRNDYTILIPCENRETAETLLLQAQSAYLSDNGIHIPDELASEARSVMEMLEREEMMYNFLFTKTYRTEMNCIINQERLAKAVETAGGKKEFCRKALSEFSWDDGPFYQSQMNSIFTIALAAIDEYSADEGGTDHK